ncbi:metallophosphoesterase [Planctomycetaceae bacterium SH139]
MPTQRALLLFYFVLLMLEVAEAGEPLRQWVFVPEYVLGERAGNQPGPRIPHPRGDFPLVEVEASPVKFRGMVPTQRLTHLMPAGTLPTEAFTLEMWLCHHVNQPVAAIMTARSSDPQQRLPWTFGFHNWETVFQLRGAGGADVQLSSKMKEYAGFKERWVHQVLAYDGHDLVLYVNGARIASGHMHHEELNWPAEMQLELAAYMQNEPFMQWANLVHSVRIYDHSLSGDEIVANFERLKQDVEAGKLYPDIFHFTAGPYLNFTTTTSIAVVCEADRPSAARIQWGRTDQLGEELSSPTRDRLHEFTITGLRPDTPYFYRITAEDSEGETIDSGLLTFKTAVEKGQPFRFAVVGDTESRPHINDQLAKQIWGERPHFVVNLGDLTDAGKQPHRYEWTHEYFVGMTQLTSRIPLFAVPGNGEGDLYWYNHYHHYPEPEGYYAFTYGDATFFMLDSNQRQMDFLPGGKQYVWLDQQLEKCSSKWKFVCHHHASVTSEEDDYGDSWREPARFGDEWVKQIIPLYEKHNVDMVMFGHLHLYERSYPLREGSVDFADGVVHLLAGGGGGNLEDFAPTPAFFSAKTHRGHHYLTIEIVKDSMNMRMFDVNGQLKDFFTLTKSTPGKLSVSRPNR